MTMMMRFSLFVVLVGVYGCSMMDVAEAFIPAVSSRSSSSSTSNIVPNHLATAIGLVSKQPSSTSTSTSRNSSTSSRSTRLNAMFRPLMAMNTGAVLPILRREVSILAQAGFTIIFGFLVARFKRRLLEKLIERRAAKKGNRENLGLGRLVFFDVFINFLIAKVVLMFLLTLFRIDLGPGLSSLFAAGGIGAVILGIASQDLAKQIVGGFVLATWDVFEEGDEIQLLASGIEGRVLHIGAMDTEIEQPSNLRIKIPNSQIFNQRVTNLSRAGKSQVKQTLRFSYKDLHKLPTILQTIKDEIKKSLGPIVITDGSKPFRCHLYDYREDHVQVLVNVHLFVPPSSARYMDERQRVLEAIGTAVTKCGVAFAIPAVNYYGGGSNGIIGTMPVPANTATGNNNNNGQHAVNGTLTM